MQKNHNIGSIVDNFNDFTGVIEILLLKNRPVQINVLCVILHLHPIDNKAFYVSCKSKSGDKHVNAHIKTNVSPTCRSALAHSSTIRAFVQLFFILFFLIVYYNTKYRWFMKKSPRLHCTTRYTFITDVLHKFFI